MSRDWFLALGIIYTCMFGVIGFATCFCGGIVLIEYLYSIARKLYNIRKYGCQDGE